MGGCGQKPPADQSSQLRRQRGVRRRGGGLYVQYITYIEAANFNQDASFNLTVYVFLGGAATLLGSIAGPVFMLLIPQLISLLPIPPSMTGPLQQLIYGLLLVCFMLFRPDGLVRKGAGGGSGNMRLPGRRRSHADA